MNPHIPVSGPAKPPIAPHAAFPTTTHQRVLERLPDDLRGFATSPHHLVAVQGLSSDAAKRAAELAREAEQVGLVRKLAAATGLVRTKGPDPIAEEVEEIVRNMIETRKKLPSDDPRYARRITVERSLAYTAVAALELYGKGIKKESDTSWTNPTHPPLDRARTELIKLRNLLYNYKGHPEHVPTVDYVEVARHLAAEIQHIEESIGR